MPEKPLFESLIAEVKKLLASSLEPVKLLAEVCWLLKERVPYYDWVGFYLAGGERELVLGPYEGDPTEHVHIGFGRGICGQAAEKGETFLVQDVSAEENYLSCSPLVKAEIVVPIFKDGAIVGELDIDSHELAPFSPEDRAFLEELCRMLAVIF
ncbi:MAG TPA: GAF domain-containing protein [archaeon]|nr:GAF domain-containing protein [archaeon]